MQNGWIKYHKRMRLNRAWLMYFPFQRQRITDGIALIFNELKTMLLHSLCMCVCVCVFGTRTRSTHVYSIYTSPESKLFLFCSRHCEEFNMQME